MVAKKKKAYKCPHCKKKIYIEDLEAIEDTRPMQTGTISSVSSKSML